MVSSDNDGHLRRTLLTTMQSATRGLAPLDTRMSYHKNYTQAQAPRPISNATEMFDTDFEDDDNSDIDIEEEYSPRISLNSAGRRSQTTVDSTDDLPTPKSNQYNGFDFQLPASPAKSVKSVEGPKGPHLFRLSQESTPEEDYYLTMSPITPRYPIRSDTAFMIPPMPVPQPQPQIKHRPVSTLAEAITEFGKTEVATWSPRQVAEWMCALNFEPEIAGKFEENDISGAILTTLKFEDLKEMDIKSLGHRHQLWAEIAKLRDISNAAPPSPTEIDCGSECEEERKPRKSKSKRRRPKNAFDDIISPLESVSIVGIEQLMPKPHKCAKGENCSRFKKQQRLIEQFKMGHPVSPDGGMILIAGDPGNPLTAPAVRPFSDAQPSVVASSDVLGPGEFPAMSYLDPERLATVQSRDPQDNVKQFLNFQHVDMQYSYEEPPPATEYEMFPECPAQVQQPQYAPQQYHSQPHIQPHLRALPRLAIPNQPPPARSASAMAFSPGPMERAEALSPDLRNARDNNIYRFGTPASDMDVPLTAVNLGPIARDVSQSVPPNMSYRNGNTGPSLSLQRSASRSSRRPSFQVGLPSLNENPELPPLTALHRPHGRQNSLPTPNSAQPLAAMTQFSPVKAPKQRTQDDVNHSGWMKKRKTRMLRHEWHEHHFTLKGTRLAMHKDESARDTLEAIDIDDYAIACSSLSSGKINSAFRAMNIRLGGSKKEEEGAFAFQLIPAVVEKAQRLKRNRESGIGGFGGEKSKTHHFAVKSRDERIDWMRELMLAKALKQKGEGFEINVNGNMI